MPIKINGVTFFQDNLVATRSHQNRLLTFNENFADLLTNQHVYMVARQNKANRIPFGSLVRAPIDLQIEAYSMFLVGRQFFTMGAFSSSNSALPVNSIVGRYSSIANKVTRMQGSHPMDRFTTSMLTYDFRVSAFNDYLDATGNTFEHVPNPIPNGGPIVIGNDVWVGHDVRFAPTGITVGDGAVIAGGALVTKDVPPYAVVGGVPAQIIKFRFPHDIIEELMKLRWWQYGFGDFHGVAPDDDIETFIDKVGNLVATGELKPFTPARTTFDMLAKASEQKGKPGDEDFDSNLDPDAL
ncbi:CatB-related O-acetyltransferase [Levilactobacillus enshiensis]|uniref:CatB-related O-acetyltransferase n=1 Tax=Levilactobacillus enshiensis TaxID=2590213 RepID=UPI00177DE58C|nr:CatB-related O-acetyltransferase [Levilactobacillus enshiensis]